MPVSTSAAARLRKDYARIMKDPVPHYVVRGPPGSPYDGGFYHGKLVFPAQYPFKPPSIYMLTPNGRFKTNTRLCLSISDFHPDTWNPAWSVSTILTGLLSFMLESSPTYGSLNSSDVEKKTLAKRSHEYNLKDRIFCELFPEIVTELEQLIEKEKNEAQRLSEAVSTPLESTLAQRGRGFLDNYVPNILVLAGVAFVAFIVRSLFLEANGTNLPG